MNKRQRKKRNKRLPKEIERLRRENAQLEREKERLRQEKKRLQQKLKRLEDYVAKLEGRTRQNSRNSSRPPSTDAPADRKKRPKSKPRSGRNAGGQPGHEGHQRELVEPERVNKTVPRKPTKCRGCGCKLSGEDPAPHRHQVTSLPKIEPHVTEYQLHTLTCPDCNLTTRASLPPGVPAGAFDPSVMAVVSLLTGLYRLSRRLAVSAMKDLFNVDISLGSVTACEQTTSAAIEPPVSEAQAYVKEQRVKGADETSWFQGKSRKKVWLWVAFTDLVTVFLIRGFRGTAVAKELLGEAFGVLVTDRWCAYTWWPLRLRQVCWAHLKRHFQDFSEVRGKAGRIGRALLVETKQLFAWWHRVRDGTLARSTFQAYVRPLRRRVEELLRKGTRCGDPKTEATCRELLKVAPAMWTFVRLEGVEPTNNSSERAIRKGVMWRNLCFGTHSEAGSRFAERMLTVVATLRQQNRNVVDYVTQSVEAALKGEAAPSLLPNSR